MSSTATRWANPHLLRWARKRVGLSLSQVESQSKQLGKSFQPISAQELAACEEGSNEPLLEHLETLAELYVCPLGYFFLDEPPSQQWSVNFRGLSPGKEGKLDPLSNQTLHRFREHTQWISHLIDSMGLDWHISIGEAHMKEAYDQVALRERERMGFNAEIRQHWTSPSDAFQWWRHRIENMGVFCFMMKLAPGDIRGASLWEQPRTPAILVNHEDFEAHTGRMFTLLHEYGHLILRRSGYACDFRGSQRGQEIETYVNKFASHVLINQEEFEAHVRQLGLWKIREKWGDSILDEIRDPFRVSRHVVAIRLEEAGLTPQGLYWTKQKQWEKKKLFAFSRPGTKRLGGAELKLREIGFSTAKILKYPSLERYTSLLDLSHTLNMKVDQVSKFVGWLQSYNP